MLQPDSSRFRQVQVAIDLLLAASRRDTRILDLGAGEGHVTEMLAGQGRRIVLADISLASLSRARQRMGSDIRCALCDAGRPLPFVDGSFDLVAMIGLLGGLTAEAETRLWDDLHRLLRPGGQIVCLVSLRRFPYSALAPDRVASLWSWRHFDQDGLLARIAAHGFHVTRQLQLGGTGSLLLNLAEFFLAAPARVPRHRAKKGAHPLLQAIRNMETREFDPSRTPRRPRYLYIVAKRT